MQSPPPKSFSSAFSLIVCFPPLKAKCPCEHLCQLTSLLYLESSMAHTFRVKAKVLSTTPFNFPLSSPPTSHLLAHFLQPHWPPGCSLNIYRFNEITLLTEFFCSKFTGEETEAQRKYPNPSYGARMFMALALRNRVSSLILALPILQMGGCGRVRI